MIRARFIGISFSPPLGSFHLSPLFNSLVQSSFFLALLRVGQTRDEPNGYRPSGPLISCALRTDHRAARRDFRSSADPRRLRAGARDSTRRAASLGANMSRSIFREAIASSDDATGRIAMGIRAIA